MESKYLNRFQKLPADSLPLRGNRVLVEVLPKEEIKSAGGLFIGGAGDLDRTSTEMNRPVLAVVLAVGAGYLDDDGKEIEIDIKPGAVILVSPMGLRYYSHFPGISEFTGQTVALTRDSEVHCAWKSIEDYQVYQKALNL